MANTHAHRSSPDLDKFENIHQIGGIRTGTLDSHPLGRPGGRVALVDTGAGLRFTVALDRGGDIVDARWDERSGEAAFFALALVTSGTFRFDPTFAPTARVIHRASDGLLLEALHRLPEGTSAP